MAGIVEQLLHEGYLKTPAIVEAFRAVDRKDFLPQEHQRAADTNEPLYIGYGQTNSQPLTVAYMLELLQPKEGQRVLDIGAGSGWTAALFAKIVGSKGKVVAIERIPQLFSFAKKNLEKYHFKNLRLEQGDGSEGFSREAPYDLIHAAASGTEIPDALIAQLKVGGKLLMPLGEDVQALTLLTKQKDGNTTMQQFHGFAFVPLIQGKIE